MSLTTEQIVINQPAGKPYLLVQLHQCHEIEGAVARGVFEFAVLPDEQFSQVLNVCGRKCTIRIEKQEAQE